MARVKEITDGTTTVSFINTSVPGYIGAQGQLMTSELEESQLLMETPVSSMETLENYRLYVRGADHNAVAAEYQKLGNLLRQATLRKEKPLLYPIVYLKEQTRGESNPRYAKVIKPSKMMNPDYFNHPFELDSLVDLLGYSYIREHPWRGTIPGTLPTVETLAKTDGTVDKDKIHVVPVQDGSNPTHLYNYDASAGTPFSSNEITNNSVDLFRVSGSTPAVGDRVYIGWQDTGRPGHSVCTPIGNTANFTATFGLYAWTGAAFVLQTEGTNYSIYPTGPIANIFKSAGEWVINVNIPAWATTTVNSVSGWWFYIEILTITSWTTAPQIHSSEDVYGVKKSYIDISATQFKGDAPPRLLIRLYSPYGGGSSPTFSTIDKITVYAREGDPTDYFNQLSLHQYNLPSGWTRTLGTDATEGDDPRAADGRKTEINFGTTTLQERIRLTGTAKLSKLSGEHQVILVCEQSGGAVGDIRSKIQIIEGTNTDGNPTVDTPFVSTTGVDVGYQPLSCGLIKLPIGTESYGDDFALDIQIKVLSERLAGTGVLRLSKVLFMPMDWHCELASNRRDLTFGGSALRGNTRLDVDFDVLDERTMKHSLNAAGSAWSPVENWTRSVGASMLKPNTKYRLFFLVTRYDTTWGGVNMAVNPGSQLTVEVFAVDSFLALRGNT